MPVNLRKIVSGGQTGVDRAALDIAGEIGIARGGWCPLGRKAEDGRIADHYPLQETPSDDYAERTLWNVRDSDGTLIICPAEPSGGTAMTIEFARALGRPHLIVHPDNKADFNKIGKWIAEHDIGVLNIAGPRESGAPGIYARAKEVLRQAFAPISG